MRELVGAFLNGEPQKLQNVPTFLDADEIFSSGNYFKVVPVNRIEDRDLQPGPIAARAKDLYWDYSHG